MIVFGARCLMLVLILYLAGWLGHATAYTETKVSLIWLPPGIAIGILFRRGFRNAPLVFLGVFLIQMAVAPSVGLSSCIALGSTLGPLAATWILKNRQFDPSFSHRRDVLIFLVATLLGMIVTATGGSLSLWSAGIIPWVVVGPTWLIWWLGDVVGVLLAAPFFLALSRENIRDLVDHRDEIPLFLVLFLVLAWVVFFFSDRAGGPVLVSVLTVWATMRFGILGGALSILSTALLAAYATAIHRGPFYSSKTGLFDLWLHLGTLPVITLLITAIQAEGTRAKHYLNENLERFQRMAADLAVANNRAQSALRETDALRATLDENSIFSTADLEGRIIDANARFCEISGYSRDELLGETHRIVNSGHHPRSFWVEMWSTIRSRQAWRNQVCNRSKDGQLYWVDTTITPFIGVDGNIQKYISIGNDITTSKRNEIALIQARIAADAASRAKSEFLANMSHEIRTPLTAILGYAEMLAHHPEISESAENRSRTVESIQAAGHHLLTIINDILDLSKIEAERMTVEQTDTPLITVLLEVDHMMRPLAEAKGISLITTNTTPIPDRVLSDPTRLRQILLNLLGNAVKFTESGWVKMSVAVRQASGSLENSLVFEIQDSGPGMSVEQKERLFVKFSQADSTVTRRHGGTGLGLTISQRLAQLMGGDLTLLRSEPGLGSSFRVEIPLVPAPGSSEVLTLNPAAPSAPAPEPISEVFRLSGRILLAEDGRDNQKVIAFLLRKAGATVDIADNGQIALDMLTQAETSGDPYQLLITDMQMPVLDGYALTRTLRSRRCTMPIIALTAHSLMEDRQLCMDSGCDDYLCKPIDRKTLLSTCQRWSATQSAVRSL